MDNLHYRLIFGISKFRQENKIHEKNLLKIWLKNVVMPEKYNRSWQKCMDHAILHGNYLVIVL